jgi:superfamily II DNA or RNA helicase
MHTKLSLRLSERLKPLADALRDRTREQFDIRIIEWSNAVATANGLSGPTRFRVSLDFGASSFGPLPDCSICGRGQFCPHVSQTVIFMSENGLADEIEENDCAPCSFSYGQGPGNRKQLPPWIAQLGGLAQRLSYSVPAEPRPPRFPAGREIIYVIRYEKYSHSDEALQIEIVTRAGGLSPAPTRSPAKYYGNYYRNFTAGVRALALSADPLDREIAEKISLASTSDDYRRCGQQLQFSIPFESSASLIARLAQSGRLFLNTEYTLHDGILPLRWLCDEAFDLKFQISAQEREQLALNVCAVSPRMTIAQREIKAAAPRFFVDAQSRLGLFRGPVRAELFAIISATSPILVPRAQAAELIEKVMSIPAGLGIEFTNCDDIRPPRLTGTPRPRIHIKAPPSMASTLEAQVRFEYDGTVVPLGRRISEFYDKRRIAIVQIDNDFHDRSLALLLSLGVKSRQRYGETSLTLPKKKLPAIVGQLIHHGWHVEADGKLYRTGSKCDLSVVSGIDWFELQGKAHFDQASIELPRLIQSLQSGERSIVLDDGSIGVIPEEWVKRFAGVAQLASVEDGAVSFGRSQVGLLDALLAEQGEINVDEKFAAARQALRAFDRIQPQEPPAGFVGTLRPYQKLAHGWFEFLRTLGFGGCLADDMGLGKTIQVLSLLEQRRDLGSGPSLIVVPRSLIFNWIAEARKFAPNLRVLDQSHSQRRKETVHLADFDLVLSTYGTLRRDAAFLKDFEFDYLILDEAQAIKNAGTEAAKAVRLLTGRHKLALSGTPIENHLGELWSLFDFLNPGMLGRLGRFAGLAQEADADQRDLLSRAVRPFILRRTKRQVAPELPERVEQTILVELDPERRRAYDELRDYYRQMLLNKINADGIGKSQIVILEALLRLRQAACHPGLIDKARIDEPSAKLDELLARLASATESGERVLVFSQFTSFLAIVKLRLKQAKIPFLYLDGKTKNRQELVDHFQSGDGPAVFLISLKAGGVGLNLTAARTVYLLDPWWNPAVEAQAIDRVHRIGQQQTVFATRLIAADTVEQKVLELQSKKKGLADAIINADNAGISSLTREDLELLLA